MLLAHSYGGMVATQLADRIPEQIRKLIYLDAFVPQDSQSLFDLPKRVHMRRTPRPAPPGTTPSSPAARTRAIRAR